MTDKELVVILFQSNTYCSDIEVIYGQCDSCPLGSIHREGKLTTCNEVYNKLGNILCGIQASQLAAKNWLIENCTDEELLEYLL